MEERLLGESLIIDEAKPLCRNGSSSTTTAVVVLSTLVAVCGSFCYRCAYSVFGSIITVGGMIGAIFSGRIADILGRKGAMWLSVIFCTVGWLAIAFTECLHVINDVTCVSLCTNYIRLAEIAPKDLRGVFTSINQLMSTCGLSPFYLIGNVISWRALALIGVIPCLLQLTGLFFIPESPRWLDHLETSQQHSEAGILDLFQRKYANSLIIGVGLMLLQQFGGVSALSYYASSIFVEAGVSSSVGSASVAIIQIPAVVLGVLLMDKAGRRPLLLISAVRLCFCYILIGLAYCLQAAHLLKELSPILVLIGFMGASVANSIGLLGIPWVIMSEIFLINVKASAGSLVTFVNWSCSWIVTYTFNFMMEWSSGGTFFIFAGVYAATVLFIAKMVPATKGKTLQEIQASLTQQQ
ncbi:hypothetical protein Q3G72_034395 [Acer saccharum]|nr:hypothetical protein Q3G72_034395 [Acer saccharum]